MNSQNYQGHYDCGLLKIGAVVSLIQSGLFILIALSAMGLGLNNFIEYGFGNLCRQNFWLFLTLCGAFILIALLGIVITPAEKDFFKQSDSGLAEIGSKFAYFGHTGTIAFFSWWVFFAVKNSGNPENLQTGDLFMPVQWGAMFELFFVGLWVWIIAIIIFKDKGLSKKFGVVSIAKAASFWLTFIGFVVNNKILLVAGLSSTALIFGPIWHIWIAIYFLRICKQKKNENERN